MSRPEPSRWLTAVLLGLIVLGGGVLRLSHLDWDRGNHLHPDERFLSIVNADISGPDGVGGYFDTARSPLNPVNHDHWYVYGTAPQFLTKGVATWLHHGATTGAQPAHAAVTGLDRLGVDLVADDGTLRFDGGYQSTPVGRLLSALLDTATILAVFELARLAAGRRAGLAAAAVWATCVLAIQHAHFFVVEPLLVLATSLVLVAAAHVAGRARGRAVLVAGGLAAGMAMACKVSAAPVVVLPVAASLLARLARADRDGRDPGAGDPDRPAAGCRAGDRPPLRRRAGEALGRAMPLVRPLAVDAVLVGVSAFVVFRVLQPYAFDGLVHLDARWLDDLRELNRLQAGGDVPPNVQWAGRLPFVEPVGHLVRFGLGVPATLLAVVGLLPLRRGGWIRQPVRLLLAAWALTIIGFFAFWFVSSMRYFLPAYPALAALAGCGAARLLAGGRAGRVAGAALLTGSVLWGLAFVNGVEATPHPRLAASDWLVANVPDGAALSVDEWDDGLPVPSPEAAAKGFTAVALKPFATQTPDEVRALAADLARVDYLVASSDRVTATVGRVPGRYAPVVRYLDALEDGSLGFEPVATFRTRPSLFGIGIDDTGAEEAFRVYDHPTVRIWRRTPAFTLERALAILQPDRAAASVHVPLGDASANGLLLRSGAASDAGSRPGATFDDLFPDRLPVPALWWLAWWELTALAALGWVGRLFRAVPDRGLGVAKLLGPLAVVVPVWSAVAGGVVDFSATTVALATTAVVALGLGVPSWRREAVATMRRRRRAVVVVEALTLGVFAAVLLLRAANPDLWFHPTGGEKPFETAFFTSVARTTTLPPADPWYSGGTMNYYYGSWFGAAVPTRLLGLRPEVALNLALATTASLVAAVAWSIGTNLASLGRRAGGRLRLVPGLLAAGGLLAVGNLDAARQQVDRARDGLAGRVAPGFDWWGLSRLNPTTTDINEFPAWSVLFGDPHPHLLSLPVLLAVLAVLVAYVATRRAGRAAGSGLGLAVLAGVGLAWVRVTHTWDLPAMALLTLLAVTVGSALASSPDPGLGTHPGPGDDHDADPNQPGERQGSGGRDPWGAGHGWGRRGPGGRWWTGAGHLAVIGVVTTAVSWPHARSTQVFDRGFVASLAHTPLGSFVLQYGIPLALLALFFGRQAIRAQRSGWLASRTGSRAGLAGSAVAVVGLLLVAGGYRGPVVGLALLVVGGALVSAVVDLRRGEVGRGLAAGLVAAGAGLAAFPDVWTVVNDIGRQNTVFKFGYTAWVLLALGTAVLAADVAGLAGRSGGRRRGGWLRSGLVAAVVVPGLLFWPLAAPPRLRERFAPIPLTLDGRDWLEHGPVLVEANGVPRIDVTADRPLIAWLRAHGRTGETLIEAAGPSYTWVGRMSVATGLPTVVGWAFHEKQQRRAYGVTVDERLAAVDDLYRRPDPERAMRVLATYRPDYLVVGTVERALGDPAALEGLADLPGLTVAVEADPGGTDAGGVIYRVDLHRIDARLAAIDAARVTADDTAPTPA